MDIDYSLLIGQFVALEPLREQHRSAIKILAKNDRIWEYTKTLLTDQRYEAMFATYFDGALSQAAQQSLVIRNRSNDAIIGMTRMYETDLTDKRTMIGHTWYIPEVWGQPHNKECKLLLLQYIFETLHFNRVGFTVAGQNLRSQRAVEKIGGVKEGVMRKFGYRGDGSLRDVVMFSIINDEWPGKKEILLKLIPDIR